MDWKWKVCRKRYGTLGRTEVYEAAELEAMAGILL